MESWGLKPDDPGSRQLIEIINSKTKKLKHDLLKAQSADEKFQLVFKFYRFYFTQCLSKEMMKLGLHKSPTRDYLLDFPWKECEQDRFFCLKIWEKINK